jgi:predicted RNA-binding protein with RPS1 domain
MAFALIGFLMSSCGGGSEICNCVDLSVKALKEMKDVNFDKDKSKKIKENYKPQLEKCNETFGNKMDEEEKKIVEEEMKNCPAAKETEKLMEEMMGGN